jgi:hypothetical protein
LEKIEGTSRTAYVRDAQGNILAVYGLIGGIWQLQEQNLYGAERLGVVQHKSANLVNSICSSTNLNFCVLRV